MKLKGRPKVPFTPKIFKIKIEKSNYTCTCKLFVLSICMFFTLIGLLDCWTD